MLKDPKRQEKAYEALHNALLKILSVPSNLPCQNIEDLQTQLEKDLSNKTKIINEHYLEFLTYPKDSKYIKAIFERLVSYNESDNCVYLRDAHPFAMMAMAKHIGVPNNFTFDIKCFAKHKRHNFLPTNRIKTITMQTVIDNESNRLATRMKIRGNVDIKENHQFDDEFFLDYLNIVGKTNPKELLMI